MQKKKFYQKILEKLVPENWFQALLCLQRIQCKLYWKMKFLNQAALLDYALAKAIKIFPDEHTDLLRFFEN